MSDVLVRQLQQVLEPWNALEGDSTSAPQPKGAPSEPWGCASAQESLAHSRAATTKLELARAALALFTSNAGAFRPALVKVFRFLFDHIDELRDDVAQLKMEQLVWQQGESIRAAGGGGPSAALSGGTPDEQNAIVSAYEKVRQTESRMAELVEEASVQRDHFKSQIEAHKKQQYHLEDLLQHQMELTQTLMDHRLRQELVGGTAAAGPSAAMGASATGEGVATAAAAVRGDVSAASDAGQGGGGRRPAERRDAAYVQSLITRADRELTLERTEDQLRDLRVHQGELENKLQSLLKLNTKYARQCVELSARLSILHENNIALAADVQLFQRDCVKEQQRSQSLLHALLVARGIVLTTLQVQPGFHADEMLDQLDAIDRTSANPQWRRYDTEAGIQGSRPPVARVGNAVQKTPLAAPFTAPDAAADALLPPLDPADEVEEGLRVLPSTDLQRQVRELLLVDDVGHGGKVKIALLHFLALETERRAREQEQQQQEERGTGQPMVRAADTQKWLSLPPTRHWVPPYGMRNAVPRHLRCATAVPLLVLHPVLAEAFVHELTTQRHRLLAFAQVQLEQAKRAAAVPSEGYMGGGGSALLEPQQISASAATSSLVSFESFIELFVLVVWLNRADRYLPLLPAVERARLEAEALVRDDAHARRVSRLVAASSSSRGKLMGAADVGAAGAAGGGGGGKASSFQTTLWELRHVLHLVRPSTEASSLPPEGLQLTYALDVASQQTGAGPLTYAYGLTSRGVLCEVLFCVLRAEREALLSLCRTVDAAIVAHAASQRVASVRQQTQPPQHEEGSESSTDETSDQVRRVNGWVPTVQFIRALLILYPGYPLRKMEQLIDAAVAEGTVGAENPAILFYERLLPGRTLPGPTTATTAADTSLVRGTHFAALFYAAVCDDAAASMQMVEDSVSSFMQGGSDEGSLATSSGGAAWVTGRQITANAFLALPRLESQQWVAGLRSAVNRWPRLRSTVADPGAGGAASAGKGATGDGDEAETDRVSTVAQVAPRDVMPYLRQNIIVRRGVFANAKTGAGATDTAAAAAAAGGAQKSPPTAALPTRGAMAKKAAAATAASAAQEAQGSLVGNGWTPSQARLLQRWDTQWAQYSSRLPAPAGPASTLFAGPTHVAEFVELLRHLDPYRTRPWGSALVCDGSAVLHPLNYAEGWPEEALDVVPAAAVASVPEAALKSAMAKVGKKNAKKAGGPPR